MPQIPGAGIVDGSITANKITAGTIIAGVVDGTILQGATVIAYGTQGELLIYNGYPVLGNLIGSWSGGAGSDAQGNTFPAGLAVEQGTISGTVAQLTQLSVLDGTTIFYTNVVFTYAVFRSSGTFTPTSNTTVSVYVVGPGGNGAAGSAGVSSGGGGAGGSSVGGTDTVTASTPYTVTVGTGGSGTASTVTFNSGTAFTAPAGGNASGGTAGAAGAAGTGPSGSNGYKGGAGGGGGFFDAAGGGGGGAGYGQNGNPGGIVNGGAGAPGVGLFPGSGAGGKGGSDALPLTGAAGVQPGGGGGGGSANGSSAAGAGAAGWVVILATQAANQLPYASVSPYATSDPISGNVIRQGITTYDNTFGGFIEVSGGAVILGGAFGSTALAGSGGSIAITASASQAPQNGLTGFINFSPAADFTTFTVTAAIATQCTKAWSIPLKDAQVGTTYRLTCSGVGTQGSTTQTLQIAFSNGNAAAAQGASFVAASTAFQWKAVLEVTIITTGSGGTANWSTVFSAQAVGGPGNTACGFTQGAAFNTTIANTLEATAKWGAATGLPSVTCYQSYIERIGP